MAGSPSPDLGDAGESLYACAAMRVRRQCAAELTLARLVPPYPGDFFEQLQARVDVVQALLLEEGADYPKLLAELEKLQELRREHEEQLAIEAQADEYDDTTPLSSSTPSHAMEVHHDHGGVDGSHELTHEQEELMFLEALAAQIANVDQQEEAREEEEEEEEGS